MALRILLADESLNIKKNLQIALQDFGVEIKSLHSGEGLLPSIKQFQPDIVLLDILLTKINGYDACSQIKNNPSTKNLPVILLWSSFMELDEEKAKICKADGKLEKPLDRDQLRKLIKHLIPKTQNQELSEFLTLPDLIKDKTPNKDGSSPRFSNSIQQENLEQENSGFDNSGLEYIKSTPEISPLTSFNDVEGGDMDDLDNWSQQPLHKPKQNQTQEPTLNPRAATATSNFKTSNLKTEDLEKIEDEYEVEVADVTLQNDELELEEFSQGAEPPHLSGNPKGPSSIRRPKPHPLMGGSERSSAGVSIAPLSIDEKHLQEIIRAQVQESIQHWVRKMMPEIAERVIRTEIQKLMSELESDSKP